MNKTFYFAVAVALSMASSTARAGEGMSFNVDGQKIRVEAPRNCNSLSCVSVTKNGSPVDMKSMDFKGRKSDDEAATGTPPPAPLAPPAPATQAAPAPAPVANTASAALPAADTFSEHVTGLPSTPPASPTSTVADQLDRLKKLDEAAAPASAPVANSAPSAPPMQQVAAAAATTPLGLWQTDKGNVRVEQCGTNLCGYGEKNGEKTKELVLVNMKPSSDNSKWTGRIHDPSSGKDYDSTITMEGPNQLKVQGCALGGMFCGTTNWKRIN